MYARTLAQVSRVLPSSLLDACSSRLQPSPRRIRVCDHLWARGGAVLAAKDQRRGDPLLLQPVLQPPHKRIWAISGPTGLRFSTSHKVYAPFSIYLTPFQGYVHRFSSGFPPNQHPCDRRCRCPALARSAKFVNIIQYLPWAGTSPKRAPILASSPYSVRYPAFSGLRAFALCRNWPLSLLIFLLSCAPLAVNFVRSSPV